MRQDYKIFLENISPSSKVIDIGCGAGDFLEILKTEKQCRVFGIEIESDRVSQALSRGLSVIQGDAGADLKFYPSKENAPDPFDYLILANTLQVMRKPKEILLESKRVSKKIMVSIPNFGFVANRLYLLFKGKMPITKQLTYEWYETPNIHFSTLSDFIDLIKKADLKIEKSFYVDHGGEIKEFDYKNPTIANLFGRNGVFLLD